MNFFLSLGGKQKANNSSGNTWEDPHARVCPAVWRIRILQHRVRNRDPDHSCGSSSKSFAGGVQHMLCSHPVTFKFGWPGRGRGQEEEKHGSLWGTELHQVSSGQQNAKEWERGEVEMLWLRACRDGRHLLIVQTRRRLRPREGRDWHRSRSNKAGTDSCLPRAVLPTGEEEPPSAGLMGQLTI